MSTSANPFGSKTGTRNSIEPTRQVGPLDWKRLWTLFEQQLDRQPVDGPLSEEEKALLGYAAYMRHSAKSTLRQYLKDIVEMRNFLRIPFRAIEPSHADAFVEYLVGKKLLPSSIRAKAAACRSFFAWLVKSRMIVVDSFGLVRLPKITPDIEANIIGRALSFTEVDQALVVLEREFRPRDLAIFYVMARMGLRASELCALTWGKLVPSFHGWALDILGKGKKRRILTVPDKGVEYLLAYREAKHAIPPGRKPTPPCLLSLPLFAHFSDPSRPMGRHNLYRITRRIWKKAGLRPFSPHDLRHTCLTHLAVLGASAENLRLSAGHASIETTYGYINAGRVLSKTTSLFNRSPGLDDF